MARLIGTRLNDGKLSAQSPCSVHVKQRWKSEEARSLPPARKIS